MSIRNRENFTCPGPVPQTVSTERFNPKWRRWNVISELVGAYGWQAGAELGLWQGRTIAALLSSNPGLTMIGVDLWQEQPGNPGPEGWEGWDHDMHERRCRAMLKRYGKRAIIIKDDTVAAATKVANESLDFVFIDADHSYQGCHDDIVAWLPKIKPEGWILGHDISWPGVREACDKLVPGYEIGPDVVWMRPVNPTPGWADDLIKGRADAI